MLFALICQDQYLRLDWCCALCLLICWLLPSIWKSRDFYQQARDDAHFCLFPPTHTIWLSANINILSKLDLYLLAHLWKDLNLKKLKKLHANWKVSNGNGWKIPFFPKTIIYRFWVAGSREDINHGQIDFWIFISQTNLIIETLCKKLKTTLQKFMYLVC